MTTSGFSVYTKHTSGRSITDLYHGKRRTNPGVWGAESAIHHKPHSVHSLPGNTLHVVPLICMAAMVQA